MLYGMALSLSAELGLLVEWPMACELGSRFSGVQDSDSPSWWTSPFVEHWLVEPFPLLKARHRLGQASDDLAVDHVMLPGRLPVATVRCIPLGG